MGLLKEVEGELAQVFKEELRVTFYAHDGPLQMVGHDYVSDYIAAMKHR